MANFLSRTALSTLIFATLIYLAYHYHWLQFGRLQSAFLRHGFLLWCDALFLASMSLIAVVRHHWALRVVRVPRPWIHVAAANIMGQGIGQWAPGSMAVSEAVRIIFLLGLPAGSQGEVGARVGIAFASLGDRLLGLGAMFFVGAAACVGLLFTHHEVNSVVLEGLAVVYLLGGASLALLPVFGISAALRPIMAYSGSRRGKGIVARGLRTLAGIMNQIEMSSMAWRARRGAVSVTLGLGVLAGVLNTLAFACAAVAVEMDLSVLTIAAALPLTVLGMLAPVGIAGLGGPQVMFVVVFGLFGFGAETVVALTLLQAALSLLVQSALAVAWITIRPGDLRLSLLRARPSP